MNEPRPVSDQAPPVARPVFLSYATKDRKTATSVCRAIEDRGIPCWISARDVAPGENYQEEIVHALRASPVMVLVFSAAANESDEIKKELSLASRYQVPVIALRTADIEPSDAFAYELSTRQWIDAFDDWHGSIDLLVNRIAQISAVPPAVRSAVSQSGRKPSSSHRRRAIGLVAGLLLMIAMAAAWLWLKPSAKPEHSMVVRLAGFQLLSTDLPANIRETVDAEIAAAFNADGVVGVSTASAPPPGTSPAYALGGTIQRDAGTIRVITRLTNERSGATLWGETFNYDGKEVSKVPRHIAVDAGNVVRCGLFGASTYRRALPDGVLRDYMQFCQGHWAANLAEGRKSLVPAQRVVAAVPDFSWGWAAVAGAYWKVAMGADTQQLKKQARASGIQAADRAVSIDEKNSEALYIKSMLVERQDWIARETLLKRAVAARRLDCGCEFHQYGWMLANVGRVTDAVEQLRHANNMLALYIYTPLTLAEALVEAGKPEEARSYFDAAIALAPNAAFADQLSISKASETGDTKALRDPKLPVPAELREALQRGYDAVEAKDPGTKSKAVEALLALPEDQQDVAVAMLLADLGASHDAFRIVSRLATDEYPGPSLFWYRRLRGTLYDPGFPALATRFGLMKYWKATGTRPDACAEKAAPPFCRMI